MLERGSYVHRVPYVNFQSMTSKALNFLFSPTQTLQIHIYGMCSRATTDITYCRTHEKLLYLELPIISNGYVKPFQRLHVTVRVNRFITTVPPTH